MDEVVENVNEGTPEVASEITQEIKQPITFAQGDLCVKCFRCGNSSTLQPNITGGLRFDMYTTDQHKIILQCPTCGNRMELFYVESIQTPEVLEQLDSEVNVEEIVENEPVLEESQG